jgi:type VI secretion system secreted protein Hcp
MLFPVFLFGQDIAMTPDVSGENFEMNDLIYTTQDNIDHTVSPAKFKKIETALMMDMCGKIVMEVDPSFGITGTNTCPGVTSGTEVLVYSEGLSAVTTVGPGTPISSSPPVLQSVNLTRYTDGFSAQIRSLLITGTTIPYIEITWTTDIKDGTQRELYVYRYENCIINSVSGGGSGGEDRITENVSFAFTKACYRTYVRNFEDGTIVSQTDACADLTLIDQSTCSCGMF